MKTLLKSTLAAALLLAGAGAAQAYPDLSAFDASREVSPAERLVLCDTTAFLSTRPDLDANRIYARRDGRPWQLMIGPRFVQGGQIYSERYDRMYWKLRRNGQIDQNQLMAAQDGLGRGLVETYRDSGYLPMGFAREQSNFCTGWTREAGVRGPV